MTQTFASPHSRRALAGLAALAVLTTLACADRSTAPRIESDLAASSGSSRPSCCSTDSGSPVARLLGIRFSTPDTTIALHARVLLHVVPVVAPGQVWTGLLPRPALRVSNGSVLVVDEDGALRSVSAGTSTVYATIGAWTDSSRVTVRADVTTQVDTAHLPSAGPVGPPIALQLAPSPLVLRVGTSARLHAWLVDAAGHVVTPTALGVWTSGADSIASLSASSAPDGSGAPYGVLVTGARVGAAVVRLVAGGYAASVPVHVTASDSVPTPQPPPASTAAHAP